MNDVKKAVLGECRERKDLTVWEQKPNCSTEDYGCNALTQE